MHVIYYFQKDDIKTQLRTSSDHLDMNAMTCSITRDAFKVFPKLNNIGTTFLLRTKGSYKYKSLVDTMQYVTVGKGGLINYQ